MKAVDYGQNRDGTWWARIFNQTLTFKTREEAIQWLRLQCPGEEP